MYEQKELQRKKLIDLRRIADDLGIEHNKGWQRRKFVKEILNKQGGFVQPTVNLPANPDFEQAAAKAAEQPKDNRGGARAGAGRPIGLTDEKAKVKNLPQFPSQPIRQGLCSLFDLWASAAKIEELALSEDEADLLSLPLSQLQEYYFPGILPEIAGTWIMLIFATTRIVKPRIKLVNKVREQRQAAKKTEKSETKPPEKILHYYAEPGGSIHYIDPSEAISVTNNASKVTCPTCLKLLEKKNQN